MPTTISCNVRSPPLADLGEISSKAQTAMSAFRPLTCVANRPKAAARHHLSNTAPMGSASLPGADRPRRASAPAAETRAFLDFVARSLQQRLRSAGEVFEAESEALKETDGRA